MKQLFVGAAMLLCSLCAPAQERDILLYGHVKDSFTKVGIPKVKITLMTSDSTMIDTCRVWRNPQPGASYDATYNFRIPPRPARYIIKAEHPDYEDTYMDYEIKRVARNTYFDAPWHYMKRRERPESSMDAELGEVTVKATRVQMYYKGDTIVFNADAFNVPEGSMLDAIIRQLPNTELREGGEIYVNGRKIDNLTLNGKDFFKGNNQIMLNNLPYYTVKQIRVFDEDTERSKWLGHTVEEKEYTMDVQLKREYSIGWITNYSAGGGVADDEKLYLARLFLLRFSENSRFTAFGNINNISEEASGNSDGSWRVSGGRSGEMRYINGGMNWTVNDPDNRLSNEMNLTARHQRQDLETRTQSESYLTTGNTFGRNLSQSRSNNLGLDFSDRFFLKVPFRWVSDLKSNFSQTLRDSHGTALTAADKELCDSVNFTSNRGDVTSRNLALSWDHDFDFKLATGDVFHFNVNTSYGRTTNEQYSQNDYRYHRTPQQNAFYNRFDNTPTHNSRINGELRYELHWKSGFNIRLFANSHYNSSTETADYHRLDLLDNLWNMPYGHDFGMLPQSRDSLLMALDLSNSYHARQHEFEMRGGAVAGYSKTTGDTHIFLDAWLPLRRTWRTLDYSQAEPATSDFSSAVPTTIDQSSVAPQARMVQCSKSSVATYLSPYIALTLSRDNYQKYFILRLHKTENVAPMMSRLDRRSDTNPLAVQTGNPDLKDAQTYSANFSAQLRSNAKARSAYYNVSYATTKDDIGQGYEYDPASGRRTYRPMNISGNWNMRNEIGGGLALDSLRRWHLDMRASHNFVRTKDLAGIIGQTGSGMNTVRNHVVSAYARMMYLREKTTAFIDGTYSFRRILRTYDPASNIKEWNYGAECITSAMPWKLQLSTSLRMYSRRGYGSADLNDNNLVWDVNLSRTFCHGNLTAMLKGHDLLGQLSDVSYSVNAQGRTEVWSNSLTRYAMLTLQYKFSKMPKKH